MDKYEVILDIGSQYIGGATAQNGFYYRVPACAAVEIGTKNIAAIGLAALQLNETQPGRYQLTHPVLEGAAVDVEGTKMLLNELFSHLLPSKYNIFSNVKIICVVHCGMISSDKNTLENILLALGAKSVSFIETPLIDSLEIFRQFRTNRGILVNIGADTTDFAVVYGDNIVAGCTLYEGARRLTSAVIDRVRNKYLVKLPFEEAEQLKTEGASLYPNDVSSCSVSGENIQNGNNETVNISSKELYDTVAEFFKKDCKIIESLLSSVPDQISTPVKSEGVFLCGGGARFSGLDLFLHNELNLPVRVAQYPEEVTLKGGVLYLNK